MLRLRVTYLVVANVARACMDGVANLLTDNLLQASVTRPDSVLTGHIAGYENQPSPYNYYCNPFWKIELISTSQKASTCEVVSCIGVAVEL